MMPGGYRPSKVCWAMATTLGLLQMRRHQKRFRIVKKHNLIYLFKNSFGWVQNTSWKGSRSLNRKCLQQSWQEVMQLQLRLQQSGGKKRLHSGSISNQHQCICKQTGGSEWGKRKKLRKRWIILLPGKQKKNFKIRFAER